MEVKGFFLKNKYTLIVNCLDRLQGKSVGRKVERHGKMVAIF
jgi:hypothetical protein